MNDEALFADALSLPAGKRAELAAALLRSLDGEPERDVETAWTAEIAQRLRDIEEGRAHLEDWETVRDRARERIRQP